MSFRILTGAQMQWADRQTMKAGVSGQQLMAAAGQAVASAILDRITGAQRVWIAAGPGNNGGDGLAAARLLHEQGVSVHVSLLGAVEKLHDEAKTHAELALAAGIHIESTSKNTDLALVRKWVTQADIIVDSLFGTGLSRPLDHLAAALVELINDSGKPVLSVDVASGIGSDDGSLTGSAVRASWTLPIAASKWGQWLGEGRECSGVILEPADIGIPENILVQAACVVPGLASEAQVIGNDLIRRAFPPSERTAHKGHFGHLWVLGGSCGYTGAPRLAAMGAQAVRTGLVSIACPDDIYPVIASSCLETMVHPYSRAPWQQADAVVAGPGWGLDCVTQLAKLLKASMPLVLDADALNMLAVNSEFVGMLRTREAPAVITPHPGEAARLLGMDTASIQSNRLMAAQALVEMFGCWTVLKGADSLVMSPEFQVWLCPFGSPRLATAGTGDVLAGMIGGLLARTQAFDVALPAAVALHALSGETRSWYRAGQLPVRIHALIERGVF